MRQVSYRRQAILAQEVYSGTGVATQMRRVPSGVSSNGGASEITCIQAPPTLEELRELLFRERRDRGVAITALASRLDEEIADLHRVVPIIREESTMQHREFDDAMQKLSQSQASCVDRLDGLAGVTEELREMVSNERERSSASLAEVRDAFGDFRDGVLSHFEEEFSKRGDARITSQIELKTRLDDVDSWARGEIAVLQNSLDQLREVLLSPQATAALHDSKVSNGESNEAPELIDNSPRRGEGASDGEAEGMPVGYRNVDSEVLQRWGFAPCIDQIEEAEHVEADPVLDRADTEQIREALQRYIEMQHEESRAEFAAQITDLERRITEEWTGLRGWVDAAVVAVVNRISSLECTLHSEMAQRSERLQEVSDAVESSSQQMRSMQEELEKVAFEARLSAVNSALRSMPAKAADPAMSTDALIAEHLPEDERGDDQDIPMAASIGSGRESGAGSGVYGSSAAVTPGLSVSAVTPAAVIAPPRVTTFPTAVAPPRVQPMTPRSQVFPRSQSIGGVASTKSLGLPVTSTGSLAVPVGGDQRASPHPAVRMTSSGDLPPGEPLPRTGVRYCSPLETRRGLAAAPNNASPMRGSFVAGTIQPNSSPPVSQNSVVQIRRGG